MGKGRKQSNSRQTSLYEESLCLRDKVKRRKRKGRRVGTIVIQIVANNKIPYR